MSGSWVLRRAPVVALVAVAVAAGAACGEGGGAGPVGEPAPISPAPPRAPLVPGPLPAGFQVEGASAGETGDAGVSRALLIGPRDPEARSGSGPLIVVGESSGSASIAGPGSADRAPVADLGVARSFDPYIVDDGPWTWVVFNDEPGCIEDCLNYVAGRGVGDEDLIAVARGADYEDEAPVVDPGALPDGLAPLVTAPPSDGMLTGGATRISLESAQGSGWITVQQVDAPAELALLWGFWIDDADGTRIRGQPGWSGRVGATEEGGDHGRVWVEDGTVVAALGWEVSPAVLDQVVDGLRPGTPDDLAALGNEVVARPPAPDEAPCGSAVLSGPVEDIRWVVGLGAGGRGDPAAYEACTELVTPSGPTAGTGGSGTLAPVGSVTVGSVQVGGGPVGGTFVYGAAPPGTATVDLVTAGGATSALQLSDAGPRERGERWFATFQPAPLDDATVIARAADGSELARAPVGS